MGAQERGLPHRLDKSDFRTQPQETLGSRHSKPLINVPFARVLPFLLHKNRIGPWETIYAHTVMYVHTLYVTIIWCATYYPRSPHHKACLNHCMRRAISVFFHNFDF